VSSLAALAADVPANAGSLILATIDARMGEVYAATFRRGADGSVDPLAPETVGPASLLTFPNVANGKSGQWSVTGSGWAAYHDAIASRMPGKPTWTDGARYPQARAIARLAEPQFASGQGVLPELALPVYLRDKVALTLDEQRANRN